MEIMEKYELFHIQKCEMNGTVKVLFPFWQTILEKYLYSLVVCFENPEHVNKWT